MKRLFTTMLVLFIISFIGSMAFTLMDTGRAMDGDAENKNTAVDYDSIKVLVNKDYSLSKAYKPNDLVIPNVKFAPGVIDEEKMMRMEAAGALENLINKAKSEKINLYCVSGYRSYNNQKQTYEKRIKSKGIKEAEKYVAYPGQSEHQTGLAMDLSNTTIADNESIKNFGNTKEGKWLAQNAHLYGFIIRYPKDKEKITGYSYEPWHIRYVGLEIAKEIYAQGVTLDEYFMQ